MMGRKTNYIIRDNNWLLSRLDFVWTKYFSDISQSNKVFIKFGRFAKFRLGSIKFDKKRKTTLITITSMFKHRSVPAEVIDHTIAHELVHYSHGFSSLHPKLHKYPHVGGVVGKEMMKRGMGQLLRTYKVWIKSYRSKFTQRYERSKIV